MADEDIESKYKYTTAKESLQEKDWAAGSSQVIKSKQFVIKYADYKFYAEYSNVEYAPSWYKTFDEPIVNAIDHLKRCLDTDHKVTVIKVYFDVKTGRIKVYNNGPGIEVAIHKTASKILQRECYVPTLLISELYQGSNRHKSEESIVGGTNGVGAKVSNYLSSECTLETVDKVRGKFFQQTWENGADITHSPIIVDLPSKSLTKEQAESHTTISFMPSYAKHFKYACHDGKQFTGDASTASMLCDIVRTRTAFASAYAHYTTPKVSVYFNDVLLPFKNMTDITGLFFPQAPIFKTLVRATTQQNTKQQTTKQKSPYKYDWELCVADISSVDIKRSEPLHISNVNGIVVPQGKHIKKIQDLIEKSLKGKISKTLNEKDIKISSYIQNNLFIAINSKIPNPQWTGQRKDVLDTDIRKFANYELDSKFINSLSKSISEQITANLLNQGQKTKKEKVAYDKYRKADRAGTKDSSKCGLIAAEGDSALEHIKNALSYNNMFSYLGVISTGGVILNARKHCDVINEGTSSTNGALNSTPAPRYIKTTSKFDENIFWKALLSYVGLNPHYTYLPGSPTYKKEMSELNYGYICAAVDQDLDGKGNILGLLISSFGQLFPNLLKAGFVKWYATPIIRAYPKSGGKVHEFYSLLEYDKWTDVASEALPKYDIRYYKGLGTHSREEIVQMFKEFSKHLYTYYCDERSDEYMHIYYGKEPSLRKLELAKPTVKPTQEQFAEIDRTMKISTSLHLTYETNLYQKDNLERKLDHVIDGENQAGRKILDGILKAFKKTKAIKIAVLAGFISEKENYHHGEDSLCGSLTSRGFIAPGGMQLPKLRPLSNFGTRAKGGADASKPRYIWGALNKPLTDLLYPKEDYCMLEFNFDEGIRGEPKYFIPIIPMAITESKELPGHGWKLETWARDAFDIITNVKRLIYKDTWGTNNITASTLRDIELLEMKTCTYKGAAYEWKGSLETVRGEPYSFGDYYIDKSTNTLVITELPLRRWTAQYIQMLHSKVKDSPIIADGDPDDVIVDRSNDTTIHIRVSLKPDSMDLLTEMGDAPYTDGVQEYFQLRSRLVTHLNLINTDDSVLECKSYSDVFYYWYPARRNLYINRVKRRIVLLRLHTTYYKNIIRYIHQSTQMNLPKKKEARMISILESEKYDRFNHTILQKPKFTPTDELEETILRGPKSNFDYLLNLTDRQKSEEKLEEFVALQQKYESELEKNMAHQTDKFPGAALWLEELTKLEHIIKEGQRTYWKFEEFGKFKY